MAGGDSQKPLQMLLRDFNSEKSQGEIRVAGFKRRIETLRSELEDGILELEESKLFKETIEQELKGYEVELALQSTSIQALETRISSVQEEVTKVGSDLEALKNDEGVKRDEFISQMFELNKKIRKFQEMINHNLHNDTIEPSSTSCNELEDTQPMHETEVSLKSLEDKLGHVISQTRLEEQDYEEEEDIHIKGQQELADSESNVLVTEAVFKEMKEMQNISKQIADLEELCASLSEELTKKCSCPNCHLENVEALGLQTTEGN
ncbi:uncharacterized protein LOC122079060 isoform X2 [Macadamia integrifolia]|uniref:uncharacterized protein LOC122079060 isoform X2 n=1 Tax=Macadamia integrifolia TaxID=60698 RepID=UPI001C4EF870|nr:uncharacterized protein LOC122079060 isoform X2 [Macadamia integrifolia]